MSSFNTPDESVQDTVAQLITGQNDANVTYDDTADQLSVDVSTLTDEEVQDIVASFVSSDSNLSWSYDDGNDTLAVSLANSILVNTLEAGVSITDPADNTITDFVGANLNLNGGVLSTETAPDVRTSLNDLFIRNAEQDFELGLTQLNYRDGQFEIFADDSKIASSTNLNLKTGINGYIKLVGFRTGDISNQVNSYTQDRAYDLASNTDYIFAVYRFAGAEIRKLSTNLTLQDTFANHEGDPTAVAVTDSYGFSADTNGYVTKWDISTMSKEQDVLTDGAELTDIVVSGDYVFCTQNGLSDLVYKIDKVNLTVQDTFIRHDTGSTCVTTDADYGYSGDGLGVVKKWDKDTFTQQSEYTSGASSINSITEKGDFLYVLTSEGASNIRKVEKSTMSEVDSFDNPSDTANAIFVAGDFGYTIGKDPTVYKFELETMSEVNQFTGHTGTGEAVIVDSGYGYSTDGDDQLLKWGEGLSAKTNGNVDHGQKDIGFVPNTGVLSDDLRQLPTGTDVYYEIADDAGNAVTVQRSEIDGEVDVSALSSSKVSTTAFLERPDTGTASPELDAWALYLNE